MTEQAIACQLTDNEFRARRAGLLAAVRDIVVTVTWQGDGLTLEIPPSTRALGTLLELIGAERACCPFLQFRLEAGPADAPTRLTITGPPGSRVFLETLRLAPSSEGADRSQEIQS